MTVSAIETIYRRQYQRFLAVAVGIVRDRDLAHDAVQETFARAIRGRDEIRSEAALPTWLWRVLTNICFAARDGAWSAIEEQTPALDGEPDAAAYPELRAAVAALPERQRLVVFLRHYADLDYKGIADVLGIERGTVAATLNAAHKRLRDALAFEEVVR